MGAPARGHKEEFADALLRWYDRHARALPWRNPPGTAAPPDPYRVWLSEVMLQQTTVATVTPRFLRFVARWPSVADLAAAPLENVLGEWAGLGYYARARNLHACAVAVTERHGGSFPDTEEELLSLPGVGAYTAAAIAAIAFGRAAVVVDGNIDRIMVRVTNINRPVREAKPAIREAAAARTPAIRAGDYAQGMMDLGATLCRPGKPDCLLCPVRDHCAAFAAGTQADLPAKPPKKERPTRRGIVYVGRRPSDGAILTERRPAKGLFGGMAGLPGSAWLKDEEGVPSTAAPQGAAWREVGHAEHQLTHFRLVLTVMAADATVAPEGFFFTPPEAVSSFPTVFRKALAVADGA